MTEKAYENEKGTKRRISAKRTQFLETLSMSSSSMRTEAVPAGDGNAAGLAMLQCKVFDILHRSNPSRRPDRWRYPMFWRDWARKDLQRGDLNALLELKRGWYIPRPARLAGGHEPLDHKGKKTVAAVHRSPAARPGPKMSRRQAYSRIHLDRREDCCRGRIRE
jgi:hypothetical protein